MCRASGAYKNFFSGNRNYMLYDEALLNTAQCTATTVTSK